MIVRCKMTCQANKRGMIGGHVQLNAVYEGSSELQKLSENSIFGDATPNGNMDLSGLATERFIDGEEYYIDFLGAGELPETSGDETAAFRMRKIFRSQFDPNWPNHASFRFAVEDSSRGGSGYLQIVNPEAVAELDKHDIFNVKIHPAVGRRSDAEIAFLEKKLEETLHLYRATTEEERERAADYWRKKITRAKGGGS